VVEPQPATRLEPGRLAHSILSVFRDGRNGDLTAGKFSRYHKLTVSDPAHAEVVLAFKTGDPALVAGRYGMGGVLVYASTCDRDWNTLPAEVPYVLLMHEMAKFLAFSREEPPDVQVGLAPQLRLSLPETVATITVSPLRPEGGKEGEPAPTPVDVTARLDARSGLLSLAPVEEPGVFRVRVRHKDGSTEERLFAVNLNTAESDLSRLPEGGLERLLPGRQIKAARQTDELLDQISRGESGAEITSHLAGIVLIMLLGEIYLSNHMRTRAGKPSSNPSGP
jgi:hypothetical protein